jgi:hypothetical protein
MAGITCTATRAKTLACPCGTPKTIDAATGSLRDRVQASVSVTWANSIATLGSRRAGRSRTGAPSSAGWIPADARSFSGASTRLTGHRDSSLRMPDGVSAKPDPRAASQELPIHSGRLAQATKASRKRALSCQIGARAEALKLQGPPGGRLLVPRSFTTVWFFGASRNPVGRACRFAMQMRRPHSAESDASLRPTIRWAPRACGSLRSAA